MDELKQKESREKYWSELTTEEKVERMRKQVRNIQRAIRGLEDLIKLLPEHNHLNNEIVVPIGSRTGTQVGEERRGGPGKDDVYF